jgi:16S rRNA (uracil1498-N3)-methyltransferase
VFLFYSNQIDEAEGKLSEEELHHCIHVLRKKEQEIIHVTDGEGSLIVGKIIQIKKSELKFEIIERQFKPKRSTHNAIALSPPKSSDRLEFFIEKTIEIGINHILLFESKRTERSRVNLGRLEKIATSAMKQSKQLYLPKIEYITDFKSFFKGIGSYDGRFIAHLNGMEKHVFGLIQPTKNNIVLIGPEGDFTQEEVDFAIENNFQPVSLGSTILRTETAGIYCATLLETLSQNL